MTSLCDSFLVLWKKKSAEQNEPSQTTYGNGNFLFHTNCFVENWTVNIENSEETEFKRST